MKPIRCIATCWERKRDDKATIYLRQGSAQLGITLQGAATPVAPGAPALGSSSVRSGSGADVIEGGSSNAVSKVELAGGASLSIVTTETVASYLYKSRAIRRLDLKNRAASDSSDRVAA